MRKTLSARNTRSTIALSSRADSRSWPNGFSMTTRRQPVLFSLSARSRSASCWHTVSKALGGIER